MSGSEVAYGVLLDPVEITCTLVDVIYLCEMKTAGQLHCQVRSASKAGKIIQGVLHQWWQKWQEWLYFLPKNTGRS